jgi:Archaeal ATPase.
LLKLKNSGSGIIPVAEILFDTGPKSRREDFFDRDKEIEELKDIILHKDFAAVLGIRRIGKTILLG